MCVISILKTANLRIRQNNDILRTHQNTDEAQRFPLGSRTNFLLKQDNDNIIRFEAIKYKIDPYFQNASDPVNNQIFVKLQT